MSNHLLAINVGNTRTQLGHFADNQLADIVYVANEERDALEPALDKVYAAMSDAQESAVVLASVNQPQAIRVEQIVENQLGARVIRVERDATIPVGRQLDPETIVGEDRLLNAAAAFDSFKQACAIISAGTALTIDFVDGVGTFHGGAILPGGQMMLDALNMRTDLLPHIRLARPDESIGRNTRQAMLAGVYYGIRGAVRELVEQYATVLGAYPRILATGGDAALLFEDDDLIERIIPELTLQGIALTYRVGLGPEDD